MRLGGRQGCKIVIFCQTSALCSLCREAETWACWYTVMQSVQQEGRTVVSRCLPDHECNDSVGEKQVTKRCFALLWGEKATPWSFEEGRQHEAVHWSGGAAAW